MTTFVTIPPASVPLTLKSPLYFSGQPQQIPGMRVAFSIAAILTLLAAASRIHAESALGAVKELPKGQVARIARIEARDGTPDPERWYILTQDPAADNGLHEFVVSNGEVVASRTISQFAESLKPGDILGTAPINIDSSKAAKLAEDYAQANGTVVARINYELKKDGPDAAPAWTISCLDDKGNKVGQVVVTAGKGNVVSHDGFALAPTASALASAKKNEEPRFDTYAQPDVEDADVAAKSGENSPADDDDEARDAEKVHAKPVHHHHHRPPEEPENPIARAFINVGRTLEKFMPF